MATFEGNEMNSCPIKMFDFSNAVVVVVSGAILNPCGHMLIQLGAETASDTVYLHVAGGTGSGGRGIMEVSGIRARPKWMNQDEFKRYLKENEKKVEKRIKLNLNNPQAAMLKLEQMLSVKWTWGILPNNCSSFVEKIISAGGGSGGLWTNCPNWATPGDYD
ncbi:hypothetical protein LZD49_31735 [Dyadobacter sp. CY261]|uniref:hypothetical protein n=1 Tax=Dyadobacter sp. CY261 TaxID=2907203 RepID=UPI001F3B6812|nr:hypothetical protein [Dyadobacter sp. CY261]MCF0075099.1 hypothetical protein [Dyadobacter sp. CY261]